MKESPLTNSNVSLAAQTAFDGPALEFDFPGLRIGVAEYDAGPTGCTVFSFPDGARMAADVRGGSSGLLGDYAQPDAICLAGGSLYGLEAATGVAAALLAERGHGTRFDQIAAVFGAIIFDFVGRDNAIYPDKALGAAAFRAARETPEQRFPLGARGAGRSATVGNGFSFDQGEPGGQGAGRSATVGNGFSFDQGEPGGQGAAFRQIGPTKLAVFTVVNAIGATVGRDGAVVRGHLDRATGQRHTISTDLERRLAAG